MTGVFPTEGVNVFEYDDYPEDARLLWPILDEIKERHPQFKVTLFCVPARMTEAEWREIERRSDWVRAGVHGFRHDGPEASRDDLFRAAWREFRGEVLSGRYRPIFKGPWYGMCQYGLDLLREHGWSTCMRTFACCAYPATAQPCYWYTDAEFRETRAHQFVTAHPTTTMYKYGKGAIAPRNVRSWLRYFGLSPEWKFTEEVVEDNCVKLNLGCGPQVWPGWICLDARAGELAGDVRQWDFSRMLPYSANRVDVVFVSHVFCYLEDEWYEHALLEIWRVLRPGAVVRLAEDRTESGYVWRGIGREGRGTGVIRSLPTRDRLMTAMNRVGFQTYEMTDATTLSPHRDVLQGNTRTRRYQKRQKCYLEGIKAISIPDQGRPRHFDIRAQRAGLSRHRLVDWVALLSVTRDKAQEFRREKGADFRNGGYMP